MASNKLHKSDWIKLIQQFNATNMSQAEFCRIRAIDVAKFRYHYAVSKESQPSSSIMPVNITSTNQPSSKANTAYDVTTIRLVNGLEISVPAKLLSSQDILSLIMKEISHATA